MTIRTTMDAAAGVRRYTVSDTLTMEDFRDALAEAYGRPQMQALSPLWDLRAARVGMSPAEMHQIADFIGERWRPPSAVRAALVVAEDLDFGMLRMLELLLGNRTSHEVMIFRDVAAAERWLAEGRGDPRAATPPG